MRELFLPFSLDPPVGLPYGYKYEVRGPMCPHTGHLHFALFLLVRPSATLYRRRHLFLGHRRTLFLTTMVEKSQILLVDAWARSSVMERKLEELVHDGLLRLRASRNQPEWRVPPSDHREPMPPEGYMVSVIAFHERGARDATEPLHAGAPPLLQGGVASPRP
jgi:hypothetical protein